MSDSRALTFVDELAQRKDQLKLRLPAHIDTDKFSAIILTAVSRNPALAKADRRSFWNAAMLAASDGLKPDGREGALIIFKSKEGVEQVQWLPMVEGIRLKARNSGEILLWDAYVVHEKDEFDCQLGDEPFIHHKPFLGPNPGPVTVAYSICKFKNGQLSYEIMTKAEIDKVRALSRAANSGPWVAWYEEMARKTVVHRHSKSIPLSSDLSDIIHRDDTPFEAIPEDEQRPRTEWRNKAQKDKLKTLATIDPKTGEIPEETVDPETGEVLKEALQQATATGTAFVKDGQVLSDEEVRAPLEPKAAPEPPKAGQRGPKSARKPSPTELMQAAGDAALAKGAAAFRQWEAALTENDMPNITVATLQAWRQALAKLESAG